MLVFTFSASSINQRDRKWQHIPVPLGQLDVPRCPKDYKQLLTIDGAKVFVQNQIAKVLDLKRNKVPGQLIVQLTDHCNALCPQCGMRKTADFNRTRLAVDDIKRIIDKAASNGVEALSLTGGEPMLFLNDLVTLINYAGAAGIKYIRTGTNGYRLRWGKNEAEFDTRVKKLVEVMADTPIRNFWISIDSACAATHEEMRGFGGLIKGAEKALPLFHEAGLYPSANLGINRAVGGRRTLDLYRPEEAQDEAYLEEFEYEMKEGFARFYQFVTDMGFTTVNMCYPMSVENDQDELFSVYTATSRDAIVNFSKEEKVRLFGTLLDTVPKYRSKIRIFTPLSSLYSIKRQYKEGHDMGYGCRGGIDFFFIDSKDGQTYPCGFLGHDSLGDYKSLDMDSIDRQATCSKCDWECFRDPSVLVGPILEAVQDPMTLFRRKGKEREFFELWRRDLDYYQACELFDGRRPPNYIKLQKFAQ